MSVNRKSGTNDFDTKAHWKQMCNGKRASLDQLFRHFYNPLFDYGLKIIREEELVRDAIQELFISIWNKRKEVANPDSVKAYLLVSLRNRILDQLKSRKNRQKRNRLYLEEIFTEEFSIDEVIFRDELDKQRKTELVKAINQLNNKQKEALFLRYYHGLTNKEIAEVMGINYQSVKNNLSGAIQNLRGIVQTLSLPGLMILLKTFPEWLC